MNIDLNVLFQALNDLAVVVMPLFGVFGVVAGIWLIASATKQLIYGSPGSHDGGPNITAIGVRFFVAACLLQFGTSIAWTAGDLLAGSGTGARSAMALVVTSSSPTWDAILKSSFLWLQVMGVAGIFRGFLKWNEAGSGDSRGGGGDPFWSGLWHIIGGAILYNIGQS